MLEIRHLKTLHALREADSLVEAAERLHLTQSALSHQFKELEERLGMPLFVRKTKPVRFTSAGLRLLQLADATLPLLRGAERDIARLAGGTAGRLHMAIECHSCFQWLMPTIDQFRDAWPEVELDLASGFAFAPPHWALHEYSSRGYVKAKRLGEKGLFATLYAGIRADMLDAPYMRDFLLTAKDTSFSTLDGVSAVR